MAALRAVAISGSPRATSRSRILAESALTMLQRHGFDTALIDLVTMPAGALLAREQSPAVDEAIAAVGEAQMVIAATPTYRALYTGVLKAFFDLMPQGHLRDKLCLPLQTGVAPQHYLAIEYGLRPLFMSLDGVPLAGVYATDDEFEDSKPSPELLSRVKDAVASAVTMLRK